MNNRQRLRNSPLVREIAVILLLKLAAILAIRWLFFAEPVDLSHPAQSVEAHIGVAAHAARSGQSPDL
jgi:hypothetical protein